jgi:hypothetical protein
VKETFLQYKPSRVPLAKQGGTQREDVQSVCWENSQEQWMEAVGLCLHCAFEIDLLSLNPQGQRANSTTDH